MRIKRLKLYNSKGIWKGSKFKLSEIEIDFTTFKPGIIGIYGASGSGKSTILYNLNPYRTNFKEDFYDDGYKELDFEFKGNEYTSIIYHDKASLFKNGQLLNSSQKVSTYDEVLEEEIGDEDVFYKLMYAGHDFSNILDLTKGQKKEIIVNYLLDYLKNYENYIVKIKEDLLADEIEYKSINDKIKNIENNKSEIQICNDLIIKLNEEIILLQQDLYILKSQQDLYEKENESISTFKQQIKLLEQEIDNKKTFISDSKTNLINLENKLSKLTNEYENIQNKIKDIPIIEDNIDDINNKINELEKIIDTKKQQENERKLLYKESALISSNLLEKKKELMRLQKSAPPCTDELQLVCPLTKQINYSQIIINLEDEIKIQTKKLNELSNKCDDIVISYDKELLEKNELNAKLKLINEYSKIDGYVKLSDKIKKDAEELIIQIEDIETDLMLPQQEIEQLENQKDLLNKNCVNQYTNNIDNIIKLEKDISIKETMIKNYNDKITVMQNELDSILDLQEQMNILENNIKDYTVLNNFFGKNGGMLFDIEMAGQQISEIANKLLENYITKSILIKFETLKLNSKGELKEVFDIACSINGDDWQTRLSGGEKILVSNAIREGMSYLRKEKEYKTVFLDELDGSLDSSARIGFIKLLEEGNQLNNRDYTLLITHSEEVKGHLEQYISLENGQIKIIN